jgi:hypothetical protein
MYADSLSDEVRGADRAAPLWTVAPTPAGPPEDAPVEERQGAEDSAPVSGWAEFAGQPPLTGGGGDPSEGGGAGGGSSAPPRFALPPDEADEGSDSLDLGAPSYAADEEGGAPTGDEPAPVAFLELEPIYQPVGAVPSEPVAAAVEDEPPRSAYALLESPDVVVVGEPFAVVVGLAAQPVEGAYGDEMQVPDSVSGSYVLTVHVIADGFALEEGDDWQVALAVTGAKPYPSVNLRLVAEPQDADVRPRAIRALYSIGGQTIGMAFRSIAVARSEALVPKAAVVETDAGFAVTGPPGPGAPDLEVCIVHGKAENAGRLVWTFKTPHAEIDVPHDDVLCDIGERPETFGLRMVKKTPTYEGQAGLYSYVAGVATTIADCVPREMWSLLSQVAAKLSGQVPSVLFLSEEPHVPWELALMPTPLRSDEPPFLSAQARVGRWVFPNPNTDRPKQPPPSVASAKSMVVVSGVYELKGWERLVEAEAEASDLESKHGAQAVNAKTAEVLKCIEGDPAADILHFAVHGQYDPTGLQDGLVLADGRALDPFQVKGIKFAGPRFIFLNACQVGMGNEVLGDYAGMAAAFLHQGAAGVVAPLWSINDALARELALEFYDAAFSGTPPAEVLRRKRADFMEDQDPTSSTFMAYQFFGHPDMKFDRV